MTSTLTSANSVFYCLIFYLSSNRQVKSDHRGKKNVFFVSVLKKGSVCRFTWILISGVPIIQNISTVYFDVVQWEIRFPRNIDERKKYYYYSRGRELNIFRKWLEFSSVDFLFTDNWVVKDTLVSSYFFLIDNLRKKKNN